MEALRDAVQERRREASWRDYMAAMAWAMARSQYREFPFPSWTEICQKKAVQDVRTAEQIRDGLIARLEELSQTKG